MKIDRPDGRHRPDGAETMVFTGRDFPPTGGGGITRAARKEFHRLETAWSGPQANGLPGSRFPVFTTGFFFEG